MMAYKVLTEDRRSPVIGNPRFSLGRWTKPARDCGPVTCFRTLRAASSFMPWLPVWKCEVVRSRQDGVWTTDFGRRPFSHIEPDVPDQILCDRVKLLRLCGKE